MHTALVTGDFHIKEEYDLDQIQRLLDVVVLEANRRNELFLLGDLFHNSKISPKELLLLVNFLKQVTVPITIIAGNHDMASETSILDWLPSVFPNIVVSKKSLVIEREGLKILLGHFNVEESVLGAYDFKLNTGISINKLEAPLALLGHIHKPQHIQGEITQVVHPGSLFYIDHNERFDTKSLVALTIEAADGEPSYHIEHIKLDPDPILQIDATLDSETNDLSGITATLGEAPLNSRVKIVIHYTNPAINKREIVRNLDKYHFKDKKITFIYQSANNLVDPVISVNTNHLELLEAYLKQNSSTEVLTLVKAYFEKLKT